MEDNPPLATLARLDYMAQFAILNQKLDSPLFVGLLNVEHRLLDNYEFFFGEKSKGCLNCGGAAKTLSK